MSDSNKEPGVLGGLFQTFFGKHWPVWVGGIVLGALNVVLFAIYYPWGASGAFKNWGQNLFEDANLMAFDKEVVPILDHPMAMMCIMIVVGSFIGALFSKEFALRIPPIGELIKGLLGGAMMAIGAAIGIGCSIGSFFTGVPALSGGAIIFTIGLFVGVIIALKYLLWEMEKFPSFSSGKSFTFLAVGSKKGTWQVILGLIVTIVVFIIANNYMDFNQVITWFIILGALMGLISQRSRFCIVKGFRDPFMTGEADGSIGIMAGLLIALVGFTALKMFNIGADATAFRATELKAVYANFWMRGAIGGLIFGIGMTIAGGCAVGTLWRVGEGQVKLWLSAIGFIVVSPIAHKFIVPALVDVLPKSMQFKNYLPDYVGYAGAFAIVVAIILIWYIFVKWNEKTGKFSAF
jgi:uncharacterized membrane protein YedE/YeeE